MPRRASSGTEGLFKHHHCAHKPKDLSKCDCAWRGRRRRPGGRRGRVTVVLSKWSATGPVDPRRKDLAKMVLARFFTAVDNNAFDPAGERPVAAGGEVTLDTFIAKEWTTHYANERGLTSNSMASMLGVLQDSKLGSMSLERLAGETKTIEAWLHETGRTRKWKAKTWNAYHEWLTRLFKQAVLWKHMASNPMAGILRKVSVQPDHFKQRHLEEDVEAKLFEKVKLLNRPQHRSTRGKLTQEQADAIRAALAAGQSGKDVAAAFQVSPAVVSSIKHGDIWNPDKLVMGTKGDEMERRLIAVFDGGLRAGEMLQVHLSMVNWNAFFRDADGNRVKCYIITLPAAITKGGKRTGENQEVLVATPRFMRMLEQRRFQLKDHKPSKQYLFGLEDGTQVKGFRRLWHDLFDLAGLEWGRDKGLVWHTSRHEFISRVAEQAGDDTLMIQEAARLKDLKTAKLYMHGRRDRRYAVLAGMGRRS